LRFASPPITPWAKRWKQLRHRPPKAFVFFANGPCQKLFLSWNDHTKEDAEHEEMGRQQPWITEQPDHPKSKHETAEIDWISDKGVWAIGDEQWCLDSIAPGVSSGARGRPCAQTQPNEDEHDRNPFDRFLELAENFAGPHQPRPERQTCNAHRDSPRKTQPSNPDRRPEGVFF
jgi:hypothetical protein